MIDFRVSVDLRQAIGAFSRYADKLGINSYEAVHKIAEDIISVANDILEGHNTNQHPELATIKDSWKISDIGRVHIKGVRLENWSPYAKYAEYGTGIHPPGGKGTITPDTHRVMKFKWYPKLTKLKDKQDKKGYVYLPYIYGQPPISYFATAKETVLQNVQSIAEEYVRKSLI